jgi:alpha-tubulin suppressor-like RCC1 family protein
MLLSRQRVSVVRFSLLLALLGGMLGAIPVHAGATGSNSSKTINESHISQTDPAPVFTQVSTGSGSRFTCAVTADGKVKCWGRNDAGQLGDGTTTQRTAPVDVLVSPGGAPLIGVSAIATGFDHACALMTSGQVKCWGVNYWGQLGDGTLDAHTTPVDVLSIPGGPPLIGVVAITSSSHHTCALMSTGE